MSLPGIHGPPRTEPPPLPTAPCSCPTAARRNFPDHSTTMWRGTDPRPSAILDPGGTKVGITQFDGFTICRTGLFRFRVFALAASGGLECPCPSALALKSLSRVLSSASCSLEIFGVPLSNFSPLISQRTKTPLGLLRGGAFWTFGNLPLPFYLTVIYLSVIFLSLKKSIPRI